MNINNLISNKTPSQKLSNNIFTDIKTIETDDSTVNYVELFFTNSVFDETHRIEMLNTYRESIAELYDFFCLELDATSDNYEELITKAVNFSMEEIKLIFTGMSKFSKYLESEETMLTTSLENANYHVRIKFIKIGRFNKTGDKYSLSLLHDASLYKLDKETKVFNIVKDI